MRRLTLTLYGVRALAGDWLALDGSTGTLAWTWTEDGARAYLVDTFNQALDLAAIHRRRCAYPVTVERKV